MGKYIFLLLPAVLTMLMIQPAGAQVNQTADASIEVMGGLSVVKITDLDFGSVFPVAGQTVLTEVDPRSDPNAASFEVISYNGAVIYVSWNVVQPGPGLEFTPEVTSHTNTPPLSAPLTNGGNFTVTQENSHSIWVGGRLEVYPNVLPGTYSGTFIISLTY